MSLKEFMQAESCMSRSSGTCNVMGTASTMASMVEALGLTLPDNAAIPAVDSRRYAQAHLAGRRIVQLVEQDVRISQILTRAAFENAIRVNGAIGGSTNAVLHLLAIAGRTSVPLSLQDWDDFGRDVPTIVDLKPSGRFLMEDFYYAGGLPAVMRALGENGLLHRDAMTVNGHSVWENVQGAAELQPRSHPAARSAAGGERWDRGAPREPRAGRRRAETVGGIAAPDAPSGPRGRVQQHRALQRAHRRSGPRRGRGLRARPSRAAVRRGIPAWRRSATWACRRRCCRPA